MKKMTRIIALALALVMILSTPLQSLNVNAQQEIDLEQLENSWVTEQGADNAYDDNLLTDEANDNEADTGVTGSEDFYGDDEIAPVEDESKIGTGENHTLTEIDRDSLDIDLTQGLDVEDNEWVLDESTVLDTDMVPVIIEFEEKSILENNANAELDFFTKMRVKALEAGQQVVINRIENKVFDGEELEIAYDYTWLVNGVSTEVPYGMIDEIREIRGVKDVHLQQQYAACETEYSPYTVADGVMIGREETWASDYTGTGMKIAVLDTGIDFDHQSFQPLAEDMLGETSATEEFVNEIGPSLNAYDLYGGEFDYYQNTKVVYGFNYADASNRLTFDHSVDEQGDHGTHVAGIAAANKIEESDVVGVAPSAQLYIMKVFGGSNGGAYTDVILAALEDALLLDADVINMSLGSPAGFSSDEDWIDEVYNMVGETDTVLCISAGNAGQNGQGSAWGMEEYLASDPDNATISSPGTYTNALTIASVNNVAVNSLYFEVAGEKYTYADANGGLNAPWVSLAGEERYEYAMVGNCGQTAEDFANANVSGKIAVVSRGVTSFYEKGQLAQDAGAVGCIVYNNVSGTITMDFTDGESTIPCISVTMATGEALAAALEADPTATIYVAAEEEILPSDAAYTMSAFSSWGVSPDLSLEPDITGPGGSIYSTRDDGTYGLMSGTSMSSPNVAGISALVKQYVNEVYSDLTDVEKRDLVQGLLMSTAPVLSYDDTVAYSPRQQGAGLANAYLATTSGAYLSVEGEDVPKIELYDDPERTGAYNYTFDVNNFSDRTIYYYVDTDVQTEDVIDVAGYKFMSSTPIVLDATTATSSNGYVYLSDYNNDGTRGIADAYKLLLAALGGTVEASDTFRYDLDGDGTYAEKDEVQAYLDYLVGLDTEADFDSEVLRVEAGETVAVTVDVAVSEAGKAFMDENFENGIYVEGFTYLTAVSEDEVDLSLPYLGFYGDWTEAPIFDTAFWYQIADEYMEYTTYPHFIYSSVGGVEQYNWYLGLNPYFGFDEEFDVNNMVVSPNGDNNIDGFDDIYIGLLRNANTLDFIFSDAETGDVYFEENIAKVSKTNYYTYGQMVPYVYTWYSEPYDFTNPDTGEVLENGTTVNLTIQATLDYDKHESINEFDTMTFPITVDTEAPEIVAASDVYTADDGSKYIDLAVTDNHSTAAVVLCNPTGTTVYDMVTAPEAKNGETEIITLDVTAIGNEFSIIVGDYGANESAYIFETTDNDPVVDEELLYGYRVYDSNYSDDTLYGWLGIDPTTAEAEVMSSEYYVDYALTAATAVGDYIVAVDADDNLVYIKPGYWDTRKLITELDFTVNQLAFDSKNEILYAWDKDNSRLVTIDVITGEVNTPYANNTLSSVTAMACDEEGNLYVMYSAWLYQIDTTTGKRMDTATCNTYSFTNNTYPSNYTQSMTFCDGSLYWARFYYRGGTVDGSLYKFADDLASLEVVGTIAGDAEVVGLLTLKEDANNYALPESELTGIKINGEEASILADGGQRKLEATKQPWFYPTGTITWTSSDEDVATVDRRGNVIGNEAGTATITATLTDGEGEDAVTFTDTFTINVVAPQGELNGFAISSANLYNQWVSFDASEVSTYEALTEATHLTFYAAEYYDGYIYAFSAAGEFYKIDAETYEMTKLSQARRDVYVCDMAFDYSTGYMYALTSSYLDGYVRLVQVDLLSGDLAEIATVRDAHYGVPVTLAIDTEGTMYMVTTTGILYTYDVETTSLTSIGLTGVSVSSYSQSMTYDHNTDTLYWAYISSSSQGIAYVDTKTGEALDLGMVDNSIQLIGLYSVPEDVEVPEVAATELTLVDDAISIIEGTKVTAPVRLAPLNATEKTINFVSDDTSVVAIEDGMLKAVGKGTATVTATVAEDTTLTQTFEVNVLEATGEIRGYIETDFSSGNGQFWGKFNDNDLSSGTAFSTFGYDIFAGEYYDGKIYTYGMDYTNYIYQYVVFEEKVTADGALTYSVVETIELDPSVVPDANDMAFNYANGAMYLIAGLNTYGTSTMYSVDLDNGNIYKVADLGDAIVSITCTTDGQMYGVNMEGIFCEIDCATGKVTQLFETGYLANQYQSMAYDHDTGNIYWAQAYVDFFAMTMAGDLLLIDVENEETINLGSVGSAGSQITALHIVPETELSVPEDSSFDGVNTNVGATMLEVDETFALEASPYPVTVNTGEFSMEFTSDNEAVATVDADGIITAVSEGIATITAACVDANGDELVSATCTVTVGDGGCDFVITNMLGAQSGSLTDLTTIADDFVLADYVDVTGANDLGVAFENTYSATYHDGYFYALDAYGFIWKYTADMSEVECLLVDYQMPINYFFTETQAVAAWVDMDMDEEGNYYLLGCESAWGEDDLGLPVQTISYKIFKISGDFSTLEKVITLPANVYLPGELEVISEDEVFLYDLGMGYLYSMDMAQENPTVSMESDLYYTLMADGGSMPQSPPAFGMTYSEDMNMMIFASYSYDEETTSVFCYDLQSKTIEPLGSTDTISSWICDINIVKAQ